MSEPKSALVVDNDAKDVALAAAVLRSSGVESVMSFDSSLKAQRFLERCLTSDAKIPDILIVDLDLQQESGYELIRYWRTTPTVTKIPLIVWSVLGDDHQEVCELFKVTSFVPKWRGREGLEEAIGTLSPVSNF